MPDSKEKILIAEDSEPNRKILEHVLSELGFEVIACEDGKHGWEEFQKNEKDICLVISDIMMPNKDGITFLEHIRQDSQKKEVPVVMVTVVADAEYVVQAKSLNVSGYLLKPISAKKVGALLKQLFPKKDFPKKIA